MTSLAEKKRKNIIIMALAVVVLIAAFIVIKIANTEEEIVTEEYSYQLTELKSGQISGIVYDYNDGSHAAYKYVDGAWYNGDDSEFPLSSSGFENQFVTTFVELKSSKKITEYEGGIEIFGLDNPYLTVTVTGNNNVSTVYKVGNYNKTIGQYYLMINEDKDNIYMITDDLEYICRKDIYDYATVDTFPAYSTSTLDYFQFTLGDNVAKLLYREEGMDADITGYGWKWFVGEPFARPMPCEASKIDTLLEEVLPTCEYTKTVNYKATDDELAAYGLDNPKGSYSIYFSEEDDAGNLVNCSVTVYIGNLSTTDSGYYTREIRRAGLTQAKSNVVRIMSTEGGEAILGMNTLEYILSNVFFLQIDDIDGSNIVFKTGDGEYSFYYDSGESADTVSDDVYKMGDLVVDSDGFKNLWYKMVSLNPERIIFDSTTIKSDEPVYTISADRIVDDYYGDITINFIKYDSTYYQVEINGETDILMRQRDVDQFFKELTEFAENSKE